MHILRKHSKLVIVITSAVFVGGMVLMGFSGMMGSNKNELGRIGDKKVSVQEFSQKFQQVAFNYQKSLGDNAQLSKEQLAKINDQVWYQMVQDYVIEEAIDEYDVQVSAKQLAKAIKEEPLEQIKKMSEFQTEGKFDQDKYLQALRLGQLNLEALESFYKQRLLIENLQLEIVGDVFVSDDDVRQEYIDQNQTVAGKLIWFNPDKVDYEQEPTMEEMRQFYQTNKQAFKKGESRVFDYVQVKFSDQNFKDEARESLQKLVALSKEKGFEKAAAELGLSVAQSEDILKSNAFFPVVGTDADLQKAMFERAAVGECSQVVEADESLLLFCLQSIDISPIYSFEQIQEKLKTALQFQGKIEKCVEDAQKFYDGKKNYLTRAKQKRLPVLNFDKLKVSDPLPELGNFPALSESLFALSEGEYTQLVVDTLVGRGAVIGKVQKRSKLDWKEFAQKKQSLQKAIKQEKSAQAFNMWFSGQFRFLEVIDNRHQFFDYVQTQARM